MIRKLHLFIIRGAALTVALLTFSTLQAQQSVGIGTANPNPNAILELKSDRQGILVPRLHTDQRVQMAQVLKSSAGNEGMIVFDIENGKFYYWFDNDWKEGLGALSSAAVHGDISGSLPAPVVVGLQGKPVSTATPTTNQVLKWDGVTWVPSKDMGIEYKAGNGLQIIGDQIINTGDINGEDDVLKTDLAGGDISGTFDQLTIQNNAISTDKVSNQAITSDKIANNAVTLEKIASGGTNTFLSIDEFGTLQWENRSNIITSSLGEGKILIGNATNAAQERSISGDLTIAFDGQATIVDNSINSAKIENSSILTEDLADNIITKEKIAADIAGNGLAQAVDGSIGINTGTGLNITANALSLSNTGVTANTYGQPDKTAKLTIDAFGRIVAAEEIAIEASPVGAAGGDLNNNYPNPTIKEGVITASKVADQAITENKLADQAIGLKKIKTLGNENAFLTTNADGEATWFKPGSNKVIITTNDGQIFTEGRSAFATSALPEGNIFVGNSVGQAAPFAAFSAARILIGTGSTLSSVAISGDLSIDVYGSMLIQEGAVTSTKILDGTIQEVDLANNAVTTNKIIDGAVTSAKIAEGTIADADLDKSHIPLSGFGAAAADVDLGNNKLTNVSDPTAAQDAATKAYVDSEVNARTDLNQGHVYIGDANNKSEAVDASASGNILVGDGTTLNSVSVSGDISLAETGAATINDNAVTTVKIADNNVTESKIATNAVTTNKIIDGAVTSAKIADGTIADEDLDKVSIPLSGFGAAAADVDLGDNKLTNVSDPTAPQDAATKAYVDNQIDASTDLGQGHVYIGDASDKAAAVDASASGNILVGDGTTLKPVAVSGDISLAETGAATINNNAVTTLKIADNNVTESKIANNAVTTNKVVDGAITSAKIADGTIANVDLDKTSIPLSGFGAAATDVDLGDNKLTNVSDPIAAQDAATKAYVDSEVNASTDLSQGHVYIGDVNNKAETVDASASGNILVGDGTTLNSVSVSGDISLTETGAATINDNAVTTVKIADNNVTESKINNNAVTTNKIIDGAVTSAKIADGTIADADLDKSNIPLSGFGAAAADVDLGDNKLTNVSDPTAAQDAATKAYVDNQIDASTDLGQGHVYIGDASDKAAAVDASASGNILVGDGTTLNSVSVSGDISLTETGAATINNNAVTTNKIIDGAVTSAKIADGTIADEDLDKVSIPLSGFGTAAADIDLGDNKLTNVSDPTVPQDAATKAYVDTLFDLDGDQDDTNEIQDLALLPAHILSLSLSGSTVDLSDYLDNTDEQNLGSSKTGNAVTVTIDNGAATTFDISDGDSDPTNESLTEAILVGTDLKITESGNETVVDLSSLVSSGTRGSLWRQGTGSPTTVGTELEGDKYLNTTNGEIWNYDGSSWQNTTQSIRGPQGEEGPQGPQGIPGVGIGTVAPGDAIKITGTFLGPTSIDVLADQLTVDFTGNEGESNRKLKVKAGGITTNELADNAITAGKIDNNAITSGKIAGLAITSGKIADGAITSEKLNDMSATEGQVMVFKSGQWTAGTLVNSPTITRAGYYAVDPLDFVELGSGTRTLYYNDGVDDAEYVAATGNNEVNIAAPIHLPHGAMIQEVIFHYIDNENGSPTFKDIFFKVKRKNKRSGVSDEIASFNSSGADVAPQEGKAAAISHGSVDNSEFSYRVIAKMRGTINHRIYSVIIKYSETIQSD